LILRRTGLKERSKMPKSLLIGVAFCALLFIACTSQPRYTSKSVEGKRDRVVSRGESGNSKEGRPPRDRSASKIDRKKMGKIIDSFLGVPYKYGGETREGIDCSGLVMQVYEQYAGFKLPRSTKKLYQLVKQVDKDDLLYGDLVFFSDGWFSVSHVGIYTDEGRFVHSIKDFGVIVSSLNEDYYKKRYRGARRVIP
jgi:cell wall-associated NlpC family hydrolase